MSEAAPPVEAKEDELVAALESTEEPEYVEYLHHDEKVTVRSDLKGLHRQACLCYSCEKHRPEEMERCKIAYAVFLACEKYSIVTPVWECAEFQKIGTKAETVSGVTGDAKVM